MGILAACNSLSADDITFLTEHESVAEFFKNNVTRICDDVNAVIVPSFLWETEW